MMRHSVTVQLPLGRVGRLAELPQARIGAARLMAGRDQLRVLAARGEARDHAQRERSQVLVQVADALPEGEGALVVPDRQHQLGEAASGCGEPLQRQRARRGDQCLSINVRF